MEDVYVCVFVLGLTKPSWEKKILYDVIYCYLTLQKASNAHSIQY